MAIDVLNLLRLFNVPRVFLLIESKLNQTKSHNGQISFKKYNRFSRFENLTVKLQTQAEFRAICCCKCRSRETIFALTFHRSSLDVDALFHNA